MSQHHKNFVVTGYFVCLIALVAGVFILALNNFNENKNAIVSPGLESTQSVNSAWQTYRNEKYGFEIKYPVAWNVTSNQDDLSFVFNNKIELSILVDRNGSRSYFEEKVNTADCLRGDDVGGCAVIPQKVSKIFAGGLEGYLREYSDNSQSFAYFADEKNNITVMLYTGNLPDKEMFREIVSTFKFIPSTSLGTGEPAVDTSNWKTYRNDEYGFEFKYPDTWAIFDKPLGYGGEFSLAVAPTYNEFSKSTTTYERCWDYITAQGRWLPMPHLYPIATSWCSVKFLVENNAGLSTHQFLMRDYADAYKANSEDSWERETSENILSAINGLMITKRDGVEITMSEDDFNKDLGVDGGMPNIDGNQQEIINSGGNIVFITNQLPEGKQLLFKKILSTFKFIK